MKILFGVLVFGVVEIVLLVALGAWIGFWLTLAWILGTAILGVLLLKTASARGRSPAGSALAHRVLVGVSGALLILPGPLTDICGLLLLLPMVRSLMLQRFASRIVSVYQRQGRGVVIESDWRDLPRDEPRDFRP